MIKVFKEKAPTLLAIEFTNALIQSPEVANLIGATSLAVDVTNKRTVFTVDSGETGNAYTVAEGQVIALSNGAVSVMDAVEFYAKYEVI